MTRKVSTERMSRIVQLLQQLFDSVRVVASLGLRVHEGVKTGEVLSVRVVYLNDVFWHVESCSAVRNPRAAKESLRSHSAHRAACVQQGAGARRFLRSIGNLTSNENPTFPSNLFAPQFERPDAGLEFMTNHSLLKS